MIPKRRKRPKMGVRLPNPEHVKCRGHIKWVKGCECILAHRRDCRFFPEEHRPGIEPHHVRHKHNRDDKTVPLCPLHHDLVHVMGQHTAEDAFKLDSAAEKHWAMSPHGKKWRREAEALERQDECQQHSR